MLGMLLCVSCSREETVGQAQDGMAEARLKVDGLSGSSGEEADSEVGIVKGFRFEDGRLEEICESGNRGGTGRTGSRGDPSGGLYGPEILVGFLVGRGVADDRADAF